MSRAATAGAMLASTAGALLVVALLLGWWGPPADLVDPPADLPGELTLLAEGFEDDARAFTQDGFEFFDFRDVLWLVTGIAAFALGLAALARLPLIAVFAAITALLATVSLVFLVMTLVSPPDYIEVTAELFGEDPFPGLDYELPFTREAGVFVALAAAIGAVAGSLLTLREGRS